MYGETIKHDFVDYKLPLFEKFENMRYTGGLVLSKYQHVSPEKVR